MGDFDLINFMMIDDVNRSTKNQQLLTDLQGKAAYLQKKTGQEPMSWYEFQQVVPKEEPHTLRNLGAGVLIGGSVGALAGLIAWPLMPALILGGAFLGGVIGAFGDTETVRRDKQVKSYEGYLNQFEMEVGRAPSPDLAAMPPIREGENVDRLRKQQAAAIAANTAVMNILH